MKTIFLNPFSLIDSKAIQSNTVEIRKENKPLQFITLTLHGTEYYRQMAMEAGADYFFSKADDFEKVAVVVDEMHINEKK